MALFRYKYHHGLPLSFPQAMQEQALAKEAAAAEKVTEAMAAAKLGQDPNLPSFSVKQTGAASSAGGPAGVSDEVAASMETAAAGAPLSAQAPTQAAGERASRLLPCCYLLLESVIEVLAEDFAMQEDEMMVIDEGDEVEEDEEGGGGAGREGGGAPQRQVRMSWRVCTFILPPG